MRVLRLLGMAVLASVLTVGLAGPAQAAGRYGHTSDLWPYKGEMQFWAHGDRLQVCDLDADGMGIEVKVTDVTQGLYKYRLEIGGVGKCKHRKASWGNPYNLREGHKFKFRICRIWHLPDLRDPSRYDCNTYYWKNDG